MDVERQKKLEEELKKQQDEMARRLKEEQALLEA